MKNCSEKSLKYVDETEKLESDKSFYEIVLELEL